jgi:Cof subfamily protein (haloacid dehalogenase superfamily)
MVAVIAVDLDGTLLRSDGQVSERTLKALEECIRQGMRVVVATGRRLASSRRFLPPLLRDGPAVYLNGAQVILDGACIHSQRIPVQDSLQVANHIETHYPDCILYADVGDRLYVNRPTDYPEASSVPRICEVLDEPPWKMVVNLGPGREVTPLVEHLPPSCRLIITAGGDWGEVVAAPVTKASGLATLMAQWGLTLADAIAFGDEMNDVEMIAESGIGVAMGNAAPEVKAVADWVAPTNDEDGVACTLERLLRGELNPS